MKNCVTCGVSKPLAAFNTRKGARDGLAGQCRDCAREYFREYDRKRAAARVEYRRAVYVAEKDSVKSASRDYYARNREAVSARKKAYDAANAAAKAESFRRWRQANADHLAREKSRWAQENPEKVRAASARRRTAQLRATPPWSDRAAIEAIYQAAVDLERATGIRHHVDHIVPLRGRTVCGLHVPANLRVIPAAENQAKGNRLVLA